ncbi:50S ribosomal protein L24e [Candidatus Pacearchaeota archaeon]|nr:50S ribosomal protein L24e [Candidatus Pacearchaeota archaeon]
MVKCVFCGREESFHKGVHLIHNNGTVSFFCSSKCRKNSLKLERDKRKLKWTEAYRLVRVHAAEQAKRTADKQAEKKDEKPKKSKK